MAEIDGVIVTRRQGSPLSREDAEATLRREGIAAEAWQNGPDYRYIPHDHPYTKVLYCIIGNIYFHVHDSGGGVHDVSLEPGDRLELDPGIVHAATVGPNGVICVEGARRSN
jgi:ARD/ARD' family